MKCKCNKSQKKHSFSKICEKYESGRRSEKHRINLLRFSVKLSKSVMFWEAMSPTGVGPLSFDGVYEIL